MKPTEQIKACAELYGVFAPISSAKNRLCKDYLTSYDAIIPLIQRQEQWLQVSIEQWLIKIFGIGFRSATPAQLVEALLRACDKWKE